MACYMIGRSQTEPDSLETLVFRAGEGGGEEAVAIFSSPEGTRAYIEAAGLGDEYTVAAVDPLPFLEWLIQADKEGVRYLAVDPSYDQQQQGEALDVIDIHTQLEHAANHILSLARPDF